MYVSAISMRLLRGRSTPAMRAMTLPLTLALLVARVATDDSNDALALDDLALDADRFDGCSNFHWLLLLLGDQGFPGVDDGLVKTQGPSSVTAIVCSKCADIERSLVTAVHLSSRTSTSGDPAFTMGSTAMTRPGLSRFPDPAEPKFGTCGSSCICRPVPWPTNWRTTEYPCNSE